MKKLFIALCAICVFNSVHASRGEVDYNPSTGKYTVGSPKPSIRR